MEEAMGQKRTKKENNKFLKALDKITKKHIIESCR